MWPCQSSHGVDDLPDDGIGGGRHGRFSFSNWRLRWTSRSSAPRVGAFFGYLGCETSCSLHPGGAAHHLKSMERRLQMLGSALGLIAIGLMGLWEIVLRLH
jgi:hypothetical protein